MALTIDHGARDHATWSASSTAANWACPGRLALIDGLPEEKENPAAAWGTACHQLSEDCLLNGGDAVERIGQTIQTKESEFEVDDEMAACAQTYVDYVRKQGEGADWVKIEQHFTLADIDPPFDAGGTADAVILRGRMLEVIDLKGGRGVVVEATGNMQLRTYALGAMLANPGVEVNTIMVTIVQPRADHKDGRIRSETFHVADLIEWTADLKVAMGRSVTAWLEFKQSPRAHRWEDRWLHAGNHCKFCPAAGFCPALAKNALDAAQAWFSPVEEGSKELTVAMQERQPNDMEITQVVAVLDAADRIQDWLNAVRAYAQQLAESGIEVPGYQLVDKRATRKWKAEESAISAALADEMFLSAEQIYAKKLRSPAQIEKEIGKERMKLLANLIDKSSSGQNLVAVAKTSRPAAQPKALQHFSKIED